MHGLNIWISNNEGYYTNLMLVGKYSSVGRVEECGSFGHGFKSHYLPQFKLALVNFRKKKKKLCYFN